MNLYQSEGAGGANWGTSACLDGASENVFDEGWKWRKMLAHVSV